MSRVARLRSRRAARWALTLSGLVAVALLFRQFWPVEKSTRAAWLADLDRLEAHTAAAYANLGDRLASRRLSPRALDQQARSGLSEARSVREARAVLMRFVEAFDDHHFVASPPESALRRWWRERFGGARGSSSEPLAWTLSGSEACAALGVEDRRFGKVDWSALAEYEPLDDDAVSHPFPAGLLRREAAADGPLAILRIGLFSQKGFPELCAAEWERWRLASRAETACDPACRRDFWRALEERLLDRFAAELEELAARGARTLLVDLSGNGGGSGIVGRMVRMVSAAELPERTSGFIRHPHSVERFRKLSADYAAEADRPELPARQRELYARLAREAAKAAQEAAESCDLRGLWELEEGSPLPCSNLGRALPWLTPAERSELSQLEAAERATSQPARPVAWHGGLWVLTDRRTASASEDFAASLQDASAAKLLGERTLGVGCGYTAGGVTLELPATGLSVRAPDCTRYRLDGRNEAEGVLPDLPVPWQDGDSPELRAEKVRRALSEVPVSPGSVPEPGRAPLETVGEDQARL